MRLVIYNYLPARPCIIQGVGGQIGLVMFAFAKPVP
jgi:hypothetical protein